MKEAAQNLLSLVAETLRSLPGYVLVSGGMLLVMVPVMVKVAALLP